MDKNDLSVVELGDNSISSSASSASLQECLENIAECFDDFYREAQTFIDKEKEKNNEQQGRDGAL